MTRRLTRLADLADYNTPGSESKAASELTEERFGGHSGQEPDDWTSAPG